jgi:hypothetical protein
MAPRSAGRTACPAERLTAVKRRGRDGPRLQDTVGREGECPAGHESHRIVAMHRLVVTGKLFGAEGANQRVVRHGRSPFVVREASRGSVRPRRSILRDLCELAPSDLRHSGGKPRKKVRCTSRSDCRERPPRKVKAAIAARSPSAEKSSTGRWRRRLRRPKSLAHAQRSNWNAGNPPACTSAFGQRR